MAAAKAMGIDTLHQIDTGLDPVTAEREQWDDGNNTLALAPRVAVAYERNVETNARLEEAGIEVVAIAGSELGSGVHAAGDLLPRRGGSPDDGSSDTGPHRGAGPPALGLLPQKYFSHVPLPDRRTIFFFFTGLTRSSCTTVAVGAEPLHAMRQSAGRTATSSAGWWSARGAPVVRRRSPRVVGADAFVHR